MIGISVKHYNTQSEFEAAFESGEAWLAGRYYIKDERKIYDNGSYFEIPKNISEFNNDLDYVISSTLNAYSTQTYADNKATTALNSAKSYTDDKISELTIPSKLSDLDNDLSVISEDAIDAKISGIHIPTKVSELTNDKEYVTKTEHAGLIPTKISVFENDADYITTSNAQLYTNQEIAKLVGTAPEKLNTIQELAAAVEDNQDLIDTLNTAIASKADKTELRSGTSNVTTVASLPVSKALVYATISANGTLSLAESLADGDVLHVVIYNSGSSEITVTLNVASGKYLDGISSVKIASKEYAEVNIIGVTGVGHLVRSVF